MAEAEKVRTLHIIAKHTGSRNPISRRTRLEIKINLSEAHNVLSDLHGKLSQFSGDQVVVEFGRTAMRWSDCSSYAKMGDLGVFGRSQMQKAFEDASYGLKEFEMSNIVDTGSGSHLILRIPNDYDLKAACRIRVLHLLAKHTESRNPLSRRTNEKILISKADAQEVIMKYIDRFKDLEGEALVSSFAKDASARSDCGSFRKGGDLGVFGVGQMQAAFENASYALKEFQLSGVVDTDSGTHVILRIPLDYQL